MVGLSSRLVGGLCGAVRVQLIGYFVGSTAASILPVESQHAVVLGSVLGKPATDYVPSFETTDAAVDPTKYPIG